MKYKIPKFSKKNASIAVKCLIAFVVLILGIMLAQTFKPQSLNAALASCTTYSGTKTPGATCVYPSCAKTTSPVACNVSNTGIVSNPTTCNCLPNCSQIAGAAEAGVNCYYLDLPICTAKSNSVSITDSGLNPDPRVNCADLIDLPLCNHLTISSQSNLKNCVNECSPTLNLLATDHNKSCIRFCDNMPTGLTANPSVNCVVRKCHQLNVGTLPTAINCSLAKCRLLVPDELGESRLQNESDTNFAKYCDGAPDLDSSGVDRNKCYNFSAAQLPYTRYRINNTMCQIHNCKPQCSLPDDTLNISNKGTDYTNLYITYINIGQPLTDISICNPVACRPVIYTPYPCSHDSSDIANPNSLTVRNTNCDSSGSGSVCATTSCVSGQPCLKNLGYCYQTVDCNLSANATRSECSATISDSSDDTDDTQSYFYRPVPQNKAYTDNNPNPSSGPNSTNNWGYRISSMCYSDLDNQSDNSSDDHRWGFTPRVTIPGLFSFSLGYFHSTLGPSDATRSPKTCDVPRSGSRMPGYAYLCGNRGNLYNAVSDKTAYFKGYIDTNHLDANNDSISRINICLRFKNGMRPDDITMPDSETCGSRECAVSCAFGRCQYQQCGFDVCKSVAVQYSSSKLCSLEDSDMFTDNNDERSCVAIIDGNLRIRLVQYGHNVCAFLDSKGQFAYNNMFFNGNEKLESGTDCVSGTYSSGNCQGSKNSNDDSGLADRWRTILKIPYIKGNTTKVIDGVSVSGYYDKSGNFFKAQECAKVPLDAPPPDLYNLNTKETALKLFTPPLSIRSVNNRKGGTISVAANPAETATDFLMPEVVVGYGTTTKTLGMGTGFTGYEVNKDPASYAFDPRPISTTVGDIVYSENILIKKEINSASNQPLICLYRRVSNNGGFFDVKVGCANRTLPEINNGQSSDPSSPNILGVRKISVTSVTTNANVLNANGIYNSSSLILKYCSDAACSNTKSSVFTPTDSTTSVCLGSSADDMEKYIVCAKREECSMLYKECMENEIRIQNNGLDSSLNTMRTNCQNLVKSCNAKKGILSNLSSSLVDQVFLSTAADPNAYGWFNEICIVSGFETKLKKVYQINTTSGVMGKCLLVSGSPLNCNGGNGNPNASPSGCNCVDASSGTPISGYNIRTQTPREAGLCIDIPLPKICPSLNYQGDNFNATSLDKTSYGANYSDITNVNPYHRDRKNTNVPYAGTLGGGHGEFPTSVVGMVNVSGVCNGFWKTYSSGGSSITPKMNCNDNSTSLNSGNWSGLLTTNSQSCIRYSCPAIVSGSTNNIDSSPDGTYANNNYYLVNETSDSLNETTAASGDIFGITYADPTYGTRGLANGYAIWPQYTKGSIISSPDQSDFLEAIFATNCLSGFQINGTLPYRNCNQLGSWKNSITNICQRKTCPAINPPYNPANSSDWNQWSNSGGATFGVKVFLKNDSANGNYLGAPVLTSGVAETHLTPASRSTSAITPGSTRKGYCNTRLGFFQGSGSNQPEADCRSDGTWSPVRNQCVTSCNAITSPGGNDGNATWNAVTNVPIGSSVVVSGTCISGYSPYPYSALKNNTGTAISPVPNFNNAPELSPTRSCQSTVVSGSVASVWSATSSTCVNTCPGSDIDSRIGVGITQHSTASYGTITINWPSTASGQTVIKTVGYKSDGTLIGSNNVTTQTASDYSVAGRNNGYFIVTRSCNSDYKWSDPVIQCPTNAGVINNSIIGNAVGSSPSNATLLASFISANNNVNSSSCSSGYSSSSLPAYKCQATSGNSNIDQYYYAKVSGNDCIQVRCTVTNSANYGSGSYYNGATTSVIAGTTTTASTINLSCKSNFGHALVSGSGSDNTCGRTTSDRTSAGPSMKCILDSSGTTASLVVSNDCAACRGCNSSSPVGSGATSTVQAHNSCNDYSDQFQNVLNECKLYNTSPLNLSHNQDGYIAHFKERKCKVNSKCRDRNTCAQIIIKCVDGAFNFSSSTWNDSCSPFNECARSSQSCGG